MSDAVLDDQSACDGCTGCAMRCTAGILVTRAEYQALRAALCDAPAERRRAVLTQAKTRRWGEDDDATYRACLFIDMVTQRCLIYPARPAICRQFGRVRHLPCPLGRVPADLPAEPLGETRPLDDWLAADGLADPAALLACYEPGRVER